MNNLKNILVCVTQQKTCERLIKRGVELKDNKQSEIYVLHVAKEGDNFLNTPYQDDALEYLFDISKENGASMTILRSNYIAKTIADFAKKNNIHKIVLGASPLDYKSSIIEELKKLLPDVEFHIVGLKGP
ncbi:Universal stress protein family protein [Caloramator fervidus]|uniref:Universal stress protein family protein n=1 Tax=Caloramator fervidus TaxID=29344 RepID=A0A1H5SQ88_9CLOT|nr:universal stress protein [Caloramator fervidus]SEF51927.1 Universal stress protein family protein [Caloramator fervidus]